MKKLFQQIDDLCVNANMHGICTALHLPWFGSPNAIGIRLGGREHVLPGPTDRLWRRKWRKFLTDHVDAIAKNLDAVAAADRDAQSGSVS